MSSDNIGDILKNIMMKENVTIEDKNMNKLIKEDLRKSINGRLVQAALICILPIGRHN
jgi:hypothetical protein